MLANLMRRYEIFKWEKDILSHPYKNEQLHMEEKENESLEVLIIFLFSKA